jgi:hypothetical protein
VNFEHVIYEGYVPPCAVMVECLTDNVNRTAPRCGCCSAGSVNVRLRPWDFDHVGND